MNLRKIRQTKHLTQFELARSANIQPGKISNVERGVSDLRLQEAIRIAKFLGISLNDLVDYKGSEKSER